MANGTGNHGQAHGSRLAGNLTFWIILVIIFLRACSGPGPGGSEIYQVKVKGIQERNIGTRLSRIRGGASPPSDEWNSFFI